MKNSTKKIACALLSTAFVFSAMGIGCGSNVVNEESNQINNLTNMTGTLTGQTKTLTKSVARDRILGAYIGSAIGMGSGYEFILDGDGTAPQDSLLVSGINNYTCLPDMYWEPLGQICSGSIGSNVYGIGPLSQPRVINGIVYSDDDLHGEIGAQYMFRDYGADLDGFDISSAWQNYGIQDVGGGWIVPSLAKKGYNAQFTGTAFVGDTCATLSEPWIENELLGLIFPYMENTCQTYNELFTSVTGQGSSRYFGDLCSLMTSIAWKYDGSTQEARKASVKSIIEDAFSMKDKNNTIYEEYEIVLDGYTKGTPWRTLVKDNISNYIRNDGADEGIEGNAFMVFTALLYGEGDFEQTVKIASLCAFDGDCTASTVGGLLGNLYGFNALPEKYRNFLNGDSLYVNHDGVSEDLGITWSAFAYMAKNFPAKQTFNQIADLTLSNLEAQVIARGGTVSGDTYSIKEQKVVACDQVLIGNAGFEDGLSSWTVNKTGNATVEVVDSGFAGRITKNVLKVTADKTESATISQKVTLKRGSVYRFSIVMDNSRRVSNAVNREVRMFAGKTSKYYAPKVYTGTRKIEYQLEMYVIGDGSTTEIGVEVLADPTTGNSDAVYFDDVLVEDVTNTINTTGTVYLAKDFTLSNLNTLVEDEVILTKDDSLRFKVTGDGTLKTLKITYRTTQSSLGLINYSIDGISKGLIVLNSTGTELGTETADQVLYVKISEGEHVIRLTGNTGNVAINGIEICD